MGMVDLYIRYINCNVIICQVGVHFLLGHLTRYYHGDFF